MKLVILSLAAFALVQPHSAAEENSILYPKQIQPKLTIRQQCQVNNEWKRHGSIKECIEEKRHEEILVQTTRILQRQEKLADKVQKSRKRIRDEARSVYEYESLRQNVKEITGNSR